jgi:hypothetical protein
MRTAPRITRPARPDIKGAKNQAISSLSHQEYIMLRHEVSRLIVSYGRDLVKAEINRRPERKAKPAGRPRKWSRTRLFALWIIVETYARLGNNNIDNACDDLERSGGLFELTEENGTLVERPIVLCKGRIRRLYYDAQRKIYNFENETIPKHKEVASKYDYINRNSLIHNFSLIVNAQVAFGIPFAPVLDYTVYFVHSELYRRGIASSPPRYLTEYLEYVTLSDPSELGDLGNI